MVAVSSGHGALFEFHFPEYSELLHFLITLYTILLITKQFFKQHILTVKNDIQVFYNEPVDTIELLQSANGASMCW